MTFQKKITSVRVDDIVIYSDYYLVTCTLQTKVKLTEATKILCYRKFSSLNIESFKTELNKVNETTFKSCDGACKYYNLTLLKLLDKHLSYCQEETF